MVLEHRVMLDTQEADEAEEVLGYLLPMEEIPVKTN
jgi:hypothetical protein